MENKCEHPIVFLKDIKYGEIRTILDYMYKGEVNVAQEELPGKSKVVLFDFNHNNPQNVILKINSNPKIKFIIIATVWSSAFINTGITMCT